MDTLHPKMLKPIRQHTDPGAVHLGIANLDLSRVTSSLDDKMASAADASIPTTAKQKPINVNWTNDEVTAIIDI